MPMTQLILAYNISLNVVAHFACHILRSLMACLTVTEFILA